MFVNREAELDRLEEWWDRRGGSLGVLWGRRRVGKTALMQHFAADRPAVFHTGGGRPAADELRALSRAAGAVLGDGMRDLGERPFADWDDAFETLAAAASSRRLLLVLDEWPALTRVSPELPDLLRAAWDRVGPRTKLKVLLSGSAIRTMEEMQEERSPLYGRLDLRLLLHPFRPHEAALMLPKLSPARRALVWGLVGGIPLYLRWWNQNASVHANLASLCAPGGPLLTEGQLVLATEAEGGDLARQVLYAIAAGRTKFHEIEAAVGADPGRTLDRLVALRLVERLVPVTEAGGRTRRRVYRIADNFLAFWLGLLDRYRPEIERGLGESILPVLLDSLDDHMGGPWEEAFRDHLRRRAAAGELGDVVAIGPFWTSGADPGEIDAVALAGRSREAVLLGEAKWAKRVKAGPLVAELRRKAEALPKLATEPRYAVGARERVEGAEGAIAITAADVF